MDILRDHEISRHSLRDMSNALRDAGIIVASVSPRLSAEQNVELDNRIRAARMTNYEIGKALAIDGYTVRARRRSYYLQLEQDGLPLPKCQCGDVFQHPHRCRYWRQHKYRSVRDVDPSEAAEIRKELIEGMSIPEVRAAHELTGRAYTAFSNSLTKKQRRERRQRYMSAEARQNRREEARTSSADLLTIFKAEMPPRLDRHIAEKACADMAYEVLDGMMTRDQAIKAKRTFIAAAYAESGYDRKQVSEVIGADGEAVQMLEFIEDETALAAFDEIEFENFAA